MSRFPTRYSDKELKEIKDYVLKNPPVFAEVPSELKEKMASKQKEK